MANITYCTYEESTVKNVLFLAPSLPYARTVVRNLAKDLDGKGIPYTSSDPNTWAEPYLNTEKVRVKFLYCDPIEYTKQTHMFAEACGVFGKLEMFHAIPDSVRKYVRRPDSSLIKYILEAERGDLCYPSEIPKTSYLPEISKVHFNPPMTIVLWADGTKTTVKCQDGDLYSEEVGLALCITKKALGNKGNFNDAFRKWIPEDRHVEVSSTAPTMVLDFDRDEFLESTSTSLRNSLLESTKNAIKRALNITHEEA